ncbi:MAG: DNA integrity scanning protein DisA nucleotide-binding domain protein, partial [Nanoarchaeota archaeon]|nr:DNA integrity scanning protein DisA nucleotide-binding domain protein [Nanoarchaeota archaeon]
FYLNMAKMDKNEVYKILLPIAKEIARQKEGALFVIGPKNKFKRKYEPLFPQLLNKHKLNDPGMDKVLVKLAVIDGAVLISNNGEVLAFGAKIKGSKPVAGYGTRHAAASGITSKVKDSTAILVSEEVNWVKVFKGGSIILETDSEDTPKSLEKSIISFLNDGDTALLTAGGISAAILGGAAVAPIMIVGGTYLAIKTATGLIKKNWKERRNNYSKIKKN